MIYRKVEKEDWSKVFSMGNIGSLQYALSGAYWRPKNVAKSVA
jgi:hypothetical protein